MWSVIDCKCVCLRKRVPDAWNSRGECSWSNSEDTARDREYVSDGKKYKIPCTYCSSTIESAYEQLNKLENSSHDVYFYRCSHEYSKLAYSKHIPHLPFETLLILLYLNQIANFSTLTSVLTNLKCWQRYLCCNTCECLCIGTLPFCQKDQSTLDTFLIWEVKRLWSL